MPKHPTRHPDLAEAKWRAAWQAGNDDPSPRPLPPLPSWTPAIELRREVLGRYLQEGTLHTGVVHDVEHATEACNLDSIRSGIWYHFQSEVPPEAVDHDCMRV